jgi:hypothetical protein
MTVSLAPGTTASDKPMSVAVEEVHAGGLAGGEEHGPMSSIEPGMDEIVRQICGPSNANPGCGRPEIQRRRVCQERADV